LKQTRTKYAVIIPVVLLVVILALFTSIYPITVPWKPVFASPDTQAFYPTGYNLLGSTQHVSGALSNLQSDNSVYMTFRSYASVTSAQTFYAHIVCKKESK
jgi:hypothetical protein